MIISVTQRWCFICNQLATGKKKAVLKGLVQTLHRRYSHTYLNVRAPPSTLTIVDRTPEVLLPAIT